MEISAKSALALVCCGCIMAGATLAHAQKKGGGGRKAAAKVERIDCKVGDENHHARIAMEARGGAVQNFAYYGKKKPRTCSMDVKRDDAFSTWEDTGNVTVVTLVDETGAFLIETARDRYHFIFRNIDRMRYCGMEGKINGSLTVWRAKKTCTVERVILDSAAEQETAPAEPPPQQQVQPQGVQGSS